MTVKSTRNIPSTASTTTTSMAPRTNHISRPSTRAHSNTIFPANPSATTTAIAIRKEVK